uniref:Uncharacterized protein n=1 Tax=Anguilla anguilla TaxID=7936 RepID=A0A0E9UEE4_ANGAN
MFTCPHSPQCTVGYSKFSQV